MPDKVARSDRIGSRGGQSRTDVAQGLQRVMESSRDGVGHVRVKKTASAIAGWCQRETSRGNARNSGRVNRALAAWAKVSKKLLVPLIRESVSSDWIPAREGIIRPPHGDDSVPPFNLDITSEGRRGLKRRLLGSVAITPVAFWLDGFVQGEAVHAAAIQGIDSPHMGLEATRKRHRLPEFRSSVHSALRARVRCATRRGPRRKPRHSDHAARERSIPLRVLLTLTRMPSKKSVPIATIHTAKPTEDNRARPARPSQ